MKQELALIRNLPPFRPNVVVSCLFAAITANTLAWAEETSTQTETQAIAPVRHGERLSHWLLRQPNGQQAANPGLSWLVPDEGFAQLYLKNTLVVELEGWARRARTDEERAERNGLLNWTRARPVTGRVALSIADPRWLEANPTHDPILQAGQQLVPSEWPLHTVAVLKPDGTVCSVLHEPGRNALDYLSACASRQHADWAWLAQPDGRTFRMEIGAWNANPVEEPAPGAWLWAPPRDMRPLNAISDGLIKFVGTQGPSPQPGPELSAAQPTSAATQGRSSGDAGLPLRDSSEQRSSPAAPLRLPSEHATQLRALPLTANDWGEAGLLQTPSARMGEAGNMRLTYSNVAPYSRITAMFQPFDWMEAGFRYSSVSNRIYGITDTQSYKDKSIDLRLRLWKESAYVPQVALGLRDIGGTGLFSSEYVVASKRWHDFDFSLGVGWGNMANGSGLGNPLGLLDDRFKVRPSSQGTGDLNAKSMFRGPMAVFGGVQWHTPWDPLTVKLEYDGNDYQSEPLGNALRHRSPFNIGLAYRVAPGIFVSAGLERGDKFMVGVSLSSNLAQASTPKVLDVPAPAVSVHAPLHPPGWAATASTIESLTEWTVTHIAPQGEVLHVWITDAQTAYHEGRLQRAIAALHAAAPASIRQFALHFSERGLTSHAQVIQRSEWVTKQTLPQPPRQARVAAETDYAPAPPGSATDRVARGEKALVAPAEPKPPTLADAADVESPWTRKRQKFTGGIGPVFSPIVGGPDAFVLYQAGIQASGEYRFNERTWLSGAVSLRLLDNFDKFKYTAPSDLPRVRTFQREYATSSRLTLPNLQLTHVGKWGADHYYSAYGGLLEGMYAGVGGEWLYRPWRSRVAFGVDINRVRQRGFKQDFSLRDYQVTTGHATLYWDTGWHGVMARVAVGQYLAGDRGATVDVSRRFSNGFVIGAYATKTNVSAEQFGEGSFDKGIYLRIPLDALLPQSSKGSVSFMWTPVLRDGGAMLSRSQPLYGLTYGADPRVGEIGPVSAPAPRNGDNLLNFDSRP